ncbi:MAG: hypothetical protein KTR30_26125 [Saprospiraceae bacterium]|nr:hypothetical protein [Saprospiraceae bacterium]
MTLNFTRKTIFGGSIILLLLTTAVTLIDRGSDKVEDAIQGPIRLDQPVNTGSKISIVEGEKRVLRWKSLIDLIKLSYKDISIVAPHFPDLAEISNAQEFDQWIQNYPEEVVQFMHIPLVKELSPSKVALGINHIETRKEIIHPYWYRYKLMDKAGKALIPNFPYPNSSLNLAKQEEKFKLALSRWSQDFPNEFEAMMHYFVPGYPATAENLEIHAGSD